MKNVLVDALRQAGTDTEPPTENGSEEAPVERSPAAGEAAALAEPREHDGDLHLAEQTPAVPVDERDRESELLVGDDPSSGEEIKTPVALAEFPEGEPGVDSAAAPIEDPTVLVPALAEAPEPATSASVTETWPDAPRPEWALVVGRWSPLLCLLTLSSAAAALGYFQGPSENQMRVDPGALDDDPQSDTQSGAAGWWQLSETTEAADIAAARQSRSDAAIAAPVPVERPVVTGKRPVNDPAFASVEAAYAAYARGSFDVAARHYEAALAVSPRHRHALTGYAAVLQKSGRSDAALAIYEQLIEIDPHDTDALAAVAVLGAGDGRDHVAHLRLLLQRQPEAAAVHFALGVELAEAGRWPEAHGAFLSAHERQPDDADYSFNVAVSAEHMGRYELARQFYKRALASVDGTSSVDRALIEARIEVLARARGDSA